MAPNIYLEMQRIVRESFHAPVYEPQKRNKDGMRWIMHRFPIKGGISYLETMAREPNGLLDILKMARVQGGAV